MDSFLDHIGGQAGSESQSFLGAVTEVCDELLIKERGSFSSQFWRQKVQAALHRFWQVSPRARHLLLGGSARSVCRNK